MRLVGLPNHRHHWRTSLDNRWSHLDFDNTTGWGYLPATEEVFEAMRWVRDKINPRRMLEIGYYAGHSTSYWAHHLPDTDIISCCPNHPKFRQTVNSVESKYRNVKVYPITSPAIHDVVYQWSGKDFCFIDGSHDVQPVRQDIMLAIDLRIPYIMMDNCEQSRVQMGIDFFGDRLKFLGEWDYTCTHKERTTINKLKAYQILDFI